MVWLCFRPHCRSSQRCSLSCGLSCRLSHQRHTQSCVNRAGSVHSCPGIIIFYMERKSLMDLIWNLRIFHRNGFIICSGQRHWFITFWMIWMIICFSKCVPIFPPKNYLSTLDWWSYFCFRGEMYFYGLKIFYCWIWEYRYKIFFF